MGYWKFPSICPIDVGEDVDDDLFLIIETNGYHYTYSLNEGT